MNETLRKIILICWAGTLIVVLLGLGIIMENGRQKEHYQPWHIYYCKTSDGEPRFKFTDADGKLDLYHTWTTEAEAVKQMELEIKVYEIGHAQAVWREVK